VWEETRATHVYLPSSRPLVGRYAALADPTLRAEVVTGLAHTHELLAGAWARENARLDKLAARLTTLTAGLEARSAGLAGQLAAAATEAADKAAEVACFRRLASDEAEALPARLARAQAEAQEQADRERALQTRYAQLMREMDDLQEKLSKA
jgi:chromosome segregation ATPase